MESGQISNFQNLIATLNPNNVVHSDSGSRRDSVPQLLSLKDAVTSLDPQSHNFSSWDEVTSVVNDHLWLVGLLSSLSLVLVLLSCSLRSNYFQENYFITRAKEWVQLPLLHPSPPRESLLSNVEAGAGQGDAGVVEAEPDTTTLNPNIQNAELCSWESETNNLPASAMKSSSDGEPEVDLCNRTENVVPELSVLSLTETSQSSAGEPAAEALAVDTSCSMNQEIPESKTSFFGGKANKDHFIFGNSADVFLTKSESLDEARSRSDLLLVRDKCFKANKSVDEILTRQQQFAKPHPPGLEHSQSGSFGTPKCRKLQERRGSNNSLTIAVTTAETTLPTVVTPRECSAAQFLLTAGNPMNRRQLRSCLKDLEAVHAEFWSIPTNIPEAMELMAPRKNRYRYVLPNPHSRVKLPIPVDPSDPSSGYINANYVRDQNGFTRAYIATQGPLSNTIADFWLMVWTEKSPAIVMITRLVESGKAKCEPYLPEDGQSGCQYGDVSVIVDSTEQTSGYTIRRLTLKVGEEVHQMAHYWYTDWPDHKTPDNPRTLVQLAVAVESLRRGQGSTGLSSPINREVGPIVVHCSAGVGRTGCFIALCQGLTQLVAEGTVDILNIVCTLRCDRGGMVQTAEQYEFIHRGLCLFERSSTLSDYDGD